MTSGEAAVQRARALVGVRFRAQGRSPESGLDCVGLVLRVFGIPESLVRRDYRLTGNDAAEVHLELRRFFNEVPSEQRCAGDVLLCRVKGLHAHVAIECGGTFVHADARVRRVVESPGAPPWPLLGSYRHAHNNSQPG